MILNTPGYEAFCKRQMAEETLSYAESLEIYEALELGAISSTNIWDGFDVDLRIAKAINGLKS